jgi:catechol 2,3-dioxygenase-like lactoylglutathione lyase family enzyme
MKKIMGRNIMAESFFTGIQHIGIPTNDIKATVDFYKALGFEIASEVFLEDDNCKVCFLKMKNLMIETYENHQAALKAGAVDHIALDVNDIDAAFNFVKAGGFKLLNDEIISLPFWSKGIKCFKIEGPNRENVEFCQIL